MKYRTTLKQAVRHAHLTPAGEELGPFLFAGQTCYDTPILESWRRAHGSRALLREDVLAHYKAILRTPQSR